MSLFCLASDDKPCENDTAIDVLSQIYGSDFIHAYFTSGSTPSEVIPGSIAPVILGGLATVAGMLAIVVFISLMLTSLVNSAQDGEAFGKGSAKSIIILRFLFSFVMLFPTASGYCIAQIILMAIVLWSNGETNKLYNNVVMKSTINNIDYQPTTGNISKEMDVFGVRGVALAHFQQAYCLNLLNANYSPSMSAPYEPVTRGSYSVLAPSSNISTAYVIQNPNPFGPVISDLILNDPADTKSGGYRVVKLVDKTGKVAVTNAAVCGGLRVTEIPENPLNTELPAKGGIGMSLESQQKIYQALAEGASKLATQKKNVLLQTTAEVSEWMVTANIPYDLNSPDYATQLNNVNFAKLRDTITNLQLKGNTDFQYAISGLNLAQLTKDLTNSLTAKGWTHAAGIKQRIIASQSSLVRAVDADVVTLTPPDFSVLQIDDSRAERFKSAVAAMNIVVEQTMGKASFSGYSDAALITQAIPSDLDENMSPKQLNADLQDRYSSLISDMKRRIVHSLIAGTFQKNTPEAALDTGIKSDWVNSEYDVLANIQKTGEIISVLSMRLQITTGAVKTALLGTFAVTGVSDTLNKAAEGAWLGYFHIIEPVITRILMYMNILETYMAVVLPSMPYFFFITGVVAWYIHILQAMAGLPFWAILHMIPERSFVGSQSQGYVTVIALFLRPLLTLTGLFFAFILANPVLLFVTEAFFAMQDEMMAASAGDGLFRFAAELGTFFNWLIIYCTLMLQVCYMIFGLAGTLPDSVLKWLGTGLNAGGWGDTNAREALSTGAGAGVSDGRNAAEAAAKRGGGGNGGTSPSGGSDGGGKPGGGGPTNDARNETPTKGGVDDNYAAKQQTASQSPTGGGASGGGTSSTPAFQDASNKFKSIGGQVGTNGEGKSYDELKELNKERSQNTRAGFATSSMVGGIAGAATGAAIGTASGVKNAFASASEAQGFSGKVKAAASGFASGFSGHTTDGFTKGREAVAQNHIASKGGIQTEDGKVTSGTQTPLVDFARAYSNLQNAKK